MTNANTYLGKKKASPPSLVGHHGPIYRTAVGMVGDLLPTAQPDTPVYPFPQKDVKTASVGCVLGVSSRTFVL